MSNMKDIAERAEVSVMTVSNVLNGKRDKMNDLTYDKVMKVMKDLDYIPNATARSLSSKKSSIIALWTPSYYDHNPLEIPYISYITGAITKYVDRAGYNLMLLTQSSVKEFVMTVKSWNITASIGIAINSKDVDYIENSSLEPFIYIDTYVDSENIFSISSNDFKGGYLATNHLIKKGHRNIAFVTGDEIYDEKLLQKNGVLYNRYKGYQKALTENNIFINQEYLIGGDISYEGGIEVGKIIGSNIESNLTGIFCTADEMAVGIKEGLEMTGNKIPNDFSIIGFDDLPLSNYVTPKLTTIQQQNVAKGKKAVDLIIDYISGESTIDLHTTFQVKLIERESVKDLKRKSSSH